MIENSRVRRFNGDPSGKKWIFRAEIKVKKEILARSFKNKRSGRIGDSSRFS